MTQDYIRSLVVPIKNLRMSHVKINMEQFALVMRYKFVQPL